MSILDAMRTAQPHIQSMWLDRCTIKVYQEVTDSVSHITSLTETVLYSDEPCKLSHSSFPATGEGIAPGRVLTVRLFLSSVLSIPSGSTIEVTTHTGRTEHFKCSGAPAVYTNHQEVNLVTEEDKA